MNWLLVEGKKIKASSSILSWEKWYDWNKRYNKYETQEMAYKTGSRSEHQIVRTLLVFK